MVRGAAKEQAREKAQKKAAGAKGGESQLKHRAAGLQIVCPACKSAMPNMGTLKTHMEAKHPGVAVPDESTFKPK